MGRRRLLSPLLFLILLLPVFLSCTSSREEKTVINFVTWKPNIPEVWEEIYKTFERENPDIKLIRQIGPHSSTAFHDMLTQKLKNRSRDVDVFLMDVIWPPEFAEAGWAMPLDGLFGREEREKFLKGTILANTYRGKIYGVPLFIDAGVLYYRKDLLDRYGYKPPETWEDLERIAKAVVENEKKRGVEIYGYSGQFKQYEGLVCDMMEFIMGNNGWIIEPSSGRVAIAEPPAVEAVRFVRDRIIGHLAPRGVLTYQEPESLDLFIQGKTVFHRNWPYAWKVSGNPERSRIAGKVGITKIPHFRGGKSYSTLGGWQVGISSYTRNKEAAWRFVRFLTSERVQKLIALRAGKAPTREALYADPDVLEANPHFKEMKEVFISAYPRPRSPLYPALSNLLQRYLSRVISRPDSDIRSEARETAEKMHKVLSLTE